MKEVGLFYLLKIGKKKYMEKLYEQGLIHMKNINWFRKCEDKELRGDKDEELARIEQVAELKLLHNGKVLARSDSAQLKFHDYENKGNLYCLIAITYREDPETFKIDEKNKKFGDCFVVITDVREFIERIVNKLKELRHEYEYGLVDYYNPKEYSGPLNVFCKPNNFGYQKEFRFFVKRNKPGPLDIEIGSIEDVAFILDIEKLDKIEINYSKIKES